MTIWNSVISLQWQFATVTIRYNDISLRLHFASLQFDTVTFRHIMYILSHYICCSYISSQLHLSTVIFLHSYISPQLHFATVTFCHSLISVQFHFATVTFRHSFISPQLHFSTVSFLHSYISPQLRSTFLHSYISLQLHFSTVTFLHSHSHSLRWSILTKW